MRAPFPSLIHDVLGGTVFMKQIAKKLALAAVAALSFSAAQAQTPALPATTFNVVGSIGNLSMYTNREVPFWNEIVPRESGGAIKVQLRPFTELGFKGPEIFRLVSAGTLQMAMTVLNYNSGEVPMNEAADLVGLVGSVEELHTVLKGFRPTYAKFLDEKHGLKLLGFGTYQAQVVYCRDSFSSIADLKGRKIRASGASQQAFVNHLAPRPSPSPSPKCSPRWPAAWSIAPSPARSRAIAPSGMRRRASSRRCRSISASPPSSQTSAGGQASIRRCRPSSRRRC